MRGSSIHKGIRLKLIAVGVGAAVLGAGWSCDGSASGGDATVEQRAAAKRAAAKLRPSPKNAFGDRAKIVDDGCFIKIGKARNGPCVYGKKSSPTTVVMFADSHGEPYFTGLVRLARERGWRLVALTKSFCPPADFKLRHPNKKGQFRECYRWRRNSIERIAAEDPDLVVVAGSVFVEPLRKGRLLKGKAAERELTNAYARTLRKATPAGVPAALVTDVPKSRFKIPDCIRKNRDRLRKCNFRGTKMTRRVARKAAARADAKLVNTAARVCPKRCRAVINRVIVYRDKGHLTSTYGGTLKRFFGRKLPKPR